MPALRTKIHVASLRLGLAATLTATALASAPAGAQHDGYKLHMEQGVKLYNDKNYPAAIVEFTAAYDARPGPNPLVNIALCEKAQFRYPKAIVALETAIDKHGAVMAPGDRTTATNAIREMRGLLGTVAIQVIPPNATLYIDGEELSPTAGPTLLLGPGPHKIGARAEGFMPGEQSVTVVSQQTHPVTLELTSNQGWVMVLAPDPQMTIVIDHQVVGAGHWAGMVPPGMHLVQVLGGAQSYDEPIQVASGSTSTVRVPTSLGTGKDEPAPRRGMYMLGTASVLFPLIHPPLFINPQLDFGAGTGLRIGFQVNQLAGFDLSYQHSSITGYPSSEPSPEVSYRILSDRIAASLRLITPGNTWRVVTTLGGGIVVDGVGWGKLAYQACLSPKKCPFPQTPTSADSIGGIDVYGLVEVAAELDVDRVLIDVGLEAQFQSTANISSGSHATSGVYEGSIYGTRPIIHVGPAARIGYRFW